jgi:DNA-binding NtrC family response regulator
LNVAAQEIRPLSDARQERPVVLVVEDEPMILMMAMEIIDDAGFEAIGASNADEAIEILEAYTSIKVVFTDVRMPGAINGIGLAQTVRKRWPDIQLIVTSGMRGSKDGMLPPGVRFFQKPYDPSQVIGAVRTMIA